MHEAIQHCTAVYSKLSKTCFFLSFRPVRHDKEDLAEFHERDPDEVSLPSQAHGRYCGYLRNSIFAEICSFCQIEKLMSRFFIHKYILCKTSL